jgi:UDP-N-acetylmuramoylalanine--D-glutamate ligase
MSKEKNYTLIVGMGKTGNAVANFLNAKGTNIVITDINDSKKAEAEKFEAKGIKTEIGFHDQSTFNNADLIIVSPGVPLTIPELISAKDRNIPITGELDTVSELIDIPIVAVTGTNGKTTVTTLIGDMLKESGLKVFVCGNIGTPIVDYLSQTEKADVIVAEISSFQLDTSEKFKPDVAVLLNITEDHLDRYESFEDYAISKWSVFKNQTENQIAVINASIDNRNNEIQKIDSKISLYSSNTNDINSGSALIGTNDITIANSIIDLAETKLKGTHNRENIAAAALATLAAKGTREGITKGLKNFIPLPHRLQFVKSINKVEYYNDSKATNPDAVARAVECFDKNVLLIMGGQEKDTGFEYLREFFGNKIKKLIVMGDAKEKIANAFAGILDIVHAESMENAVTISHQNSEPGDTVLLSPGCASFDMYDSYSQRGFDFIEQVKGLEN